MSGKVLFFIGIIAAITLAIFSVLNIVWIIKKRKLRFDRKDKRRGIIRHFILFLILGAVAFFLLTLLPTFLEELSTNKEEIVAAKNGMNLSAISTEELARYKKMLTTYKYQLMLDYAAIGTFALTTLNALLNVVLTVIYIVAKRPKVEDDEK